MRKRLVFTITFAVVAAIFAVVSVVLFCLNGNSILSAGLPFFLCLIGFGGSTITTCVFVLLGEKDKKALRCKNCGAQYDPTDSFCPACGNKL